MNILGIDFGTKNIGLAWCQTGLDVVLPFGTMSNNDQTMTKFKTLIKEERIDQIVIGMPINQAGETGTQNVTRVRNFVDKLKTHIDLPVKEHDERRTSKQADSMGGGHSSKRDERAAMIILQSYMDSRQVQSTD